jgi:NDP-sugar pyrophosphorylase family protein
MLYLGPDLGVTKSDGAMPPASPAVSVHGIVLAGTHHWKDSAFSRLAPRPLLPVGNRPLLGHVLRWFEDAGLESASVCVNAGVAAARHRLGELTSLLRVDVVEDATPRGPAGCVRDAALRSGAQTFVVIDASVVPTVDFGALVRAHRASGAGLTIVAHDSPNHTSRRLVQPNGIYVFDRSLMERIPAAGFFDIKENLIPALHRDGVDIDIFHAPGSSPRVLDPDTYLAVNHWMVEKLVREGALDGYHRRGPALVSNTARISLEARLIGPSLIGPGVEIRAGATVVGPCVLGPGTIIGGGAVVSRIVTWEGCFIGARSLVDRCIVADGAAVPRDARLVAVIRAQAAQFNEEAPPPLAARLLKLLRPLDMLGVFANPDTATS